MIREPHVRILRDRNPMVAVKVTVSRKRPSFLSADCCFFQNTEPTNRCEVTTLLQSKKSLTTTSQPATRKQDASSVKKGNEEITLPE
ncbi:MAG: hypothetical protein CMM01_18395 [Rhodopirellula sp.]|nr:hypothetical protein [Rhodopirellula sp.]